MRTILLLLSLILFSNNVFSQHFFDAEVAAITSKNDSLWSPSNATILFTGSSSIKFWNSLENDFSEYSILNNGFGGSKASDLLHFLDELVIKYNPKQVFIYEGDNDIFAKKKLKIILNDFNAIISRIKKECPDAEIVIMSAKPSLSRWKLRRKYKRLNRKVKIDL